MRHLFQNLNTYRQPADQRLGKYAELIDLIKETKAYPEEAELFSIHLYLQGARHLMDMNYSRAYEMASGIRNEIKDGMEELLAQKIRRHVPALRGLITGSAKENEPSEEIIRYYSPWSFYLVESTNRKMEMKLLDFKSPLEEFSYSLSGSEVRNIEKLPHTWETLYGIVNRARTDRGLEKLG